MLQKLLRFLLIATIAVGILYGAHRLVLENFFPNHRFDFMHFSYKFNFGITLLFTSSILLAGKKIKDQVGFVFLAETLVKIGLFLYLSKNLGFPLEKSNFLDFFVPYLGCLAVEIFVLIQFLKTPNTNNDG